jgi:hypothetical protein
MKTSMKMLFLIAAFSAALVTPAFGAERRYSVTDFDRVQIDGPYEVNLTTGQPSSAVAKGGREEIERLSIEVRGGVLRIRPNRTSWSGGPQTGGESVTIEISTRDLKSATLLGSGRLTINRLKGLRADISLAGSGHISAANVETDNLVADVIGSGRISLAGKTKTLRANIQGAGDLDAEGLTAGEARLISETAGTVVLHASRSAQVRASGLGDVTVTGKPACIVHGVSANRVRCGQ